MSRVCNIWFHHTRAVHVTHQKIGVLNAPAQYVLQFAFEHHTPGRYPIYRHLDNCNPYNCHWITATRTTATQDKHPGQLALGQLAPRTNTLDICHVGQLPPGQPLPQGLSWGGTCSQTFFMFFFVVQ